MRQLLLQGDKFMKKGVILEGRAVNPGDISWEPLSSLCDMTIYDNTIDDEKWERIAGCEIVMTNKVPITREDFERFPEIRYVGVLATGYNVVDIEAAREHGVVVTNIPAYSTDSVVQMTWAFILNLASRVEMHDLSVKRGDWTKSDTFCYWLDSPIELFGKSLGIYGFGSIGRGVAKVGQALGMKILVYTKHPEKYANYACDSLAFVSEEELLTCSDVITYHCPLTPETTGIVNKANISKMKDGVILINVSRGPVVNEQDLFDALEFGKVAGAGVDVISVEPMKEDNPLLHAKNCIITPHIAWASKEARLRLVDIAAENLRAFLAGQPVNVES